MRRAAYADAGLHESRSAAEWADPSAFGLDRCVFGTHKDIVDNQVVAFELDNEVRGSFTLSVQNPQRTERRITIIGDLGRLDGVLEDGAFGVEFVDPEQPPLNWSANGSDSGGHQGGDRRMMRSFLDACLGRSPSESGTPEEIMAGLMFAVAAEEARRSDGVVRLAASDFSLSG
jgi:predicted dehydrogenase